MNFDDDAVSEGLAAELTNTVGFSDADFGFSDDDFGTDVGMVPDDVADEVEDYDDHVLRRDAHLFDGEPEQQPEALQQQRQQLDQQAAQLEAQRQHMAAVQMQQLAMQRMQLEAQRQAALEATVPDFDVDPEGHVAAKFRLQELRQQEAAQAEQARQQFQRNTEEFARHAREYAPVVGGIEAEYIAEHLGGDGAAYQQAFDHVFNAADAQIRQQHPGLDEQGYATMRSVAAMAFLEDCGAKGVNPAQYIHQRALDMGWRANGRVPHSAQAQHQPATMQQLANMSDKQFARAMKPATPKRVQPVVDVDRMSNEEFDKMFAQLGGNSNALAFGD